MSLQLPSDEFSSGNTWQSPLAKGPAASGLSEHKIPASLSKRSCSASEICTYVLFLTISSVRSSSLCISSIWVDLKKKKVIITCSWSEQRVETPTVQHHCSREYNRVSSRSSCKHGHWILWFKLGAFLIGMFLMLIFSNTEWYIWAKEVGFFPLTSTFLQHRGMLQLWLPKTSASQWLGTLDHRAPLSSVQLRFGSPH